MTHRSRWYEIAEAYGTPRGERTERQIRLTHTGLCSALTICGIDPYVVYKIRRISGELSAFWFPVFYSWDWLPIYDEYRCIFALFMAAMSEKDFKQLLEGGE